MAKLENLPEQWIIDGFKGTLDFYYWKGIPVCRKWPVFQPYAFSETQKANQQAFAYINKLYSQMSLSVIVGFTLLAARTSQTPKDYIVRAYMKGMFAIMPPEYYATEETAQAILAQLDVALSTRALEAGGNLAAILAQLDVALSTRALEAGGNLASILTRLTAIKITRGSIVGAFRSGILASGAGWTSLVIYAGKAIFLGLQLSSNYNLTELYCVIDGDIIRVPSRDGSTANQPSFATINGVGGETDLLKQGLYDTTNHYYQLFLKREVHFNTDLQVAFRQQSGVNKNVACNVFYQPET